jgi:peptidoglycan hydrolase-like protein with peptidoglycan-binding domain
MKFPRPVYPPDAKDHASSSNGPDVKAYKRIVSRDGHWPWQPFDEEYSNQFAHEGMAAFQADHGIQGTGWVGKATFDKLTTLKVPASGVHAGEPLMDATAKQLLEEAWQIYQGWDTQKGYPGGPMVAVKGFPRPLYPPDAAGHDVSPNGSDVEAYKRTVSRAGRWVWQAFDQEFSNKFSHGFGGDVIDSGVAGVQRQQGIEATGWIGKDTFNLLRSIIVPDGRQHAGEHAMDARSVELLNSAYDRFQGHASGEPSGGSSAKARLTRAQSQIGVKESPANSNQVKYCDWYGMVGPWCAMFCTWCDQTGGNPSSAFLRGSRYAYVPYVVDDARNGRRGMTVTSSPKPGDLVCYDWGRDGEYDHIGIFESGGSSSWAAVEGNTSTSDNSNGGQVMRRSRSKGDANIVFVRIAE